MFVIVNGHPQPLTDSQTLAELLQSLSPPTPFAVARNDEFVPRSTYSHCRIYSGDRIEIVHPMVGG
jgi:sulfur carrier protein